MTNFAPELIAKAKTAKNAVELFELAKASGVELTEAEAKTYFDQLHTSGALNDDELDAVTGGWSCHGEPLTISGLPEGTRVEVVNGKSCSNCGSTIGFPRRILRERNGLKELITQVEITCAECKTVILNEVYEEDIVRL